MALITRCPGCGTAFRITPLDLQAHGGDVRCGRCARIFSGYDALSTVRDPEAAGAVETREAEPAPEPGSPEEPGIPDIPDISDIPEAAMAPEAAGITGASEIFEPSSAVGYPEHPEGSAHSEPPLTAPKAPEEGVPSSSSLPPEPPQPAPPEDGSEEAAAEEPHTAPIPSGREETSLSRATDRETALHGRFAPAESPLSFREPAGHVPENDEPQSFTPQGANLYSTHSYPALLAWGMGSFLLFLMLAAQATYFFRAEISAMGPGARSYVERYCELLQCGIPPLPQYAKLLNVESSDMQADPQRPGINTFTAVVRNHASYPQAYPLVQLTLIDMRDRPLASRTFPPPAYLENDVDFGQPIPPNGEFSVALHLDSGDLRAAGYRLLLLYPPS